MNKNNYIVTPTHHTFSYPPVQFLLNLQVSKRDREVKGREKQQDNLCQVNGYAGAGHRPFLSPHPLWLILF